MSKSLLQLLSISALILASGCADEGFPTGLLLDTEEDATNDDGGDTATEEDGTLEDTTEEDATSDGEADTATEEDATSDSEGDTATEEDGTLEDTTEEDATPEPPYRLITDPGHTSDTDAQLAEFYATYGARETFPADHVRAIEAMLRADDAANDGDFTGADALIESVFALVPRSTPGWDAAPRVGHAGSNTGHPVAYYGLRMLEQIVAFAPSEDATNSLHMTAVVAPCAVGRAPQPPGTEPTEDLDVALDPRILEDNARRLFVATSLFRHWLRAITDGVNVELQVYVLEDCSTVDFTDSEGTIVSYPDSEEMIHAVHSDVANTTDIWWVITPSGIRNTEAELERHTITGGMGLSGLGLPLLLSDDRWFTQKPNHLGEGEWTELELRTYHTQWFQHEFMHHLFRTWPEFGLEATGHQWFDRRTWPDDFEGVFEPDYYAEAITRRLRSATPSIAEALEAPTFLSIAELGMDAVLGSYERRPVENGYHEVTIERRGDAVIWQNAAEVSWSLLEREDMLFTGPDCPYGEVEIGIQGTDERVDRLLFNSERYHRLD